MRVAWHSIVLIPALLLPFVVTQAQTCSNGVAGYESCGVCCPVSCETCGGSGCADRGEGCCIREIKATSDMCSVTKAAPCNVDDGDKDGGDIASPTPSAVDPEVFYGTVTPTASMSSFYGGGGLSTASPTASPTSSPTTTTSMMLPPGAVYTTAETTSPTPVMTIPTSCANGTAVPTFRYAASTGKVGKGRLYAESPGCFTMTDIYNWRGKVSSGGILSSKGPIYQLDEEGSIVENTGPVGSPVTGKWLLAAELYVTNGAIFYCKGSVVGGDCDELRIQSTGPDDWYEVRGHGGSLYFESTIVTSWDTPSKLPQTEYEGGRSFLNCVSEKLTGDTCLGAAKNDMGECRMDIINSEMGYMGFFDSESYGMVWKVRGFCVDLSNPDVFDTTNVYGDVKGSNIHHMYYGMYTYGHQGGVWVDNKMHDNHQYGFDPHDDSDYLTIANNEVYNNVNHGIIASKRCNNAKIHDNVVHNGGQFAAGIFLHRSSDFAEVYNNKIYDMQDAGIAMLEAMNADIHDNDIDNTRFGIRMSLGSADNLVYNNVFNAVTDWGLYTYEGSDAPTTGVSNGRPQSNTFDANVISNTPGGVKFKNSDALIVTNNEFTGTTQLEFYDAQGTQWSGNSLPFGVCVDNVTSDEGVDVSESTFEGGSDELPSTAC